MRVLYVADGGQVFCGLLEASGGEATLRSWAGPRLEPEEVEAILNPFGELMPENARQEERQTCAALELARRAGYKVDPISLR